MPRTADRTKESTTTTGTGTITLAGAATQYQSFLSAFGNTSTVVQYAIVGQSGSEWEVGEGTFDGSTSLTRDVVRASSNSNNLVNFSAGTKDVFATLLAADIKAAKMGTAIAISNGWGWN